MHERVQPLALRAAAALGIDLAGVDVASDETGRGYVLEVNGAVDFNPTNAAGVFTAAAAALLERATEREYAVGADRQPTRARAPVTIAQPATE